MSKCAAAHIILLFDCRFVKIYVKWISITYWPVIFVISLISMCVLKQCDLAGNLISDSIDSMWYLGFCGCQYSFAHKIEKKDEWRKNNQQQSQQTDPHRHYCWWNLGRKDVSLHRGINVTYLYIQFVISIFTLLLHSAHMTSCSVSINHIPKKHEHMTMTGIG